MPSRRAGLPLKFFKCGWFDEKDYFEFFPLKAVYPYTKVTTAPPTLFKGSAISKIAELSGR